MAKDVATQDESGLELFACPNPECDLFNRFSASNLSVVERMGKNRAIRRLYCNHCHHRFSERAGSLMRYTKLPQAGCGAGDQVPDSRLLDRGDGGYL